MRDWLYTGMVLHRRLRPAANAFRYLRSLIWMPPETMRNGSRDLGWCCSEHALVLGLALREHNDQFCICRGSLNIHSALSYPIEPHYFVIDGDGLIYDSSVEHVGVDGIYQSRGVFKRDAFAQLLHSGSNVDDESPAIPT